MHQITDVDLRLLRVFLTVARCGSFAAAGDFGSPNQDSRCIVRHKDCLLQSRIFATKSATWVNV